MRDQYASMVLSCQYRGFDADALRVVVRAVFSVQRKFCGREERKDCQMARAPIGQDERASKKRAKLHESRE